MYVSLHLALRMFVYSHTRSCTCVHMLRSDCMLNLYFKEDPHRHICELQLVHQRILVARTSMPGHAIYGRLRNAIEIQEALDSFQVFGLNDADAAKAGVAGARCNTAMKRVVHVKEVMKKVRMYAAYHIGCCSHTLTHSLTHSLTHTHTLTHSHTHSHIHTRTLTHTHSHTHTHTYTLTHSHTHTNRSILSPPL